MTTSSAPSILNSIRKIVQSLRVASRQAEAQFGCSGAQLFVLQKLAAVEGPVSLSDLAAMTLTHISSVSVVVSRLVERGLVMKQPSPRDGRRSSLQVTAEGRAFLRSQPRTAQEELVAAVERMTADEQMRLAQLLEKLVEGAGFSRAATAMFFEENEEAHDEVH